MAGDKLAMFTEFQAAIAPQHPHDGQAHGHQGGLGVFGQGQLFDRSFKHQPREVLIQRLVDLFKHRAGGWQGLGQDLPHAHGLAALTRKFNGARQGRLPYWTKPFSPPS